MLIAVVVLALGGTPATGNEGSAPTGPVAAVFDGRGFGHGVGMAQDGALAMGRQGSDVGSILGHFYPGTSLGQVDDRSIPVTVLEPGPAEAVAIGFPAGGELRTPNRDGLQHLGFPVLVPAGTTAEIRPENGGYRVTVPGSTDAAGIWSPHGVWALPAGPVLDLPAQEARYRGHLHVTGSPHRVVNHVMLEDYLRGMGEVRDSSWPMASLQAQAIAARTYALWYLGGRPEICPTQRCQVYLGQQAEYAAMDRAVASTHGQVLAHGGRPIQALYSANAGGHLASVHEGFGEGATELPYLRPAPYPTQDPLPWSVAVPLDQVARRLGYRGTVTDVTVTKTGPSGRAIEVTLHGDAGPMAVDAAKRYDALGLRSNFFTVRLDPPPPREPDPAPVGATEAADAQPIAPPVEAAAQVAAAPIVPSEPLGRLPWVAAALMALMATSLAQVWTGQGRRAWMELRTHVR